MQGSNRGSIKSMQFFPLLWRARANTHAHSRALIQATENVFLGSTTVGNVSWESRVLCLARCCRTFFDLINILRSISFASRPADHASLYRRFVVIIVVLSVVVFFQSPRHRSVFTPLAVRRPTYVLYYFT